MAEIERCITPLGAIPPLLILGERRLGKTSVLSQLQYRLPTQYIPVLLDVSSPEFLDSASGFCSTVARKTGYELGDRGIRVPTPVFGDPDASPFPSFAQWRREVQEALPEGKKALLIFDEFEALEKLTSSGGYGGMIFSELRHIIQHEPGFAIVFAGSHAMSDLSEEWLTHFVNVVTIRVGLLRAEFVRELALLPTEESDMTYADGVIETLIENTKGHPDLTQTILYFLISRLNDLSRNKGALDDLALAIKETFERREPLFNEFWYVSMKDTQREILLAVAARESAAVTIKDILTEHPSPDKREAMIRLLDRGVLLRSNDTIDYAVPMMRQWVRDNQIL